MRPSLKRTLAVALAVGLVAAGCGGGGDDDADAADGSSDDSPIDACSFLTVEDVTPIIGDNDGGAPDDGIGESSCTWENAGTYESVNLDIGRVGIPRDMFETGPESAEAGPDGISFTEFDVALFEMGDRVWAVQVAIVNGDIRSAAVALVAKIRERYESGS